MDKGQVNQKISPYQPTREVQGEFGSTFGAYKHLDKELRERFDLETFFQFVEMTIIMRRMDEIEDLLLFGDEEEKQRRFKLVCELYSDPTQASVQENLMQTYGYQSTLYVLLIVMRLLNQEDQLTDAIKRFKEHTPETSDIWADYQWFLYLNSQGRQAEAKEILKKIQADYAWNDRFDILAVDMGLLTSETYAKRALAGQSFEARKRCLTLIANGALTETGKGFDLQEVLGHAMIYDDSYMLEAKDAFVGMAAESKKWIRLFDAWHQGDVEAYIIQLNEIREGADKNTYARWLSEWRYLWLLGDYQQMLESITAHEEEFNEENYLISMRAMKAIASARVYGQYEGYRSIRGVWYESLIHHGSRYGENAFDSILLIETAVMTKDEEVFYEIQHRTIENSWNYWWVCGRIQEYKGQLDQARESFKAGLSLVEEKNELFFIGLMTCERLALLAYEEGDLVEGKYFEDRFVSLMKKLNLVVEDVAMNNIKNLFEDSSLWNCNQERRLQVLEAKRLLAEGRMQESHQRMEVILADYRLQGHTSYYEYGALERDHIRLLLEMGYLSQAKDSIERLPDKELMDQLAKAAFWIQWARLVGDEELLQVKRDWMEEALKEAEELPKLWLKKLKDIAMLTVTSSIRLTAEEVIDLKRQVEKEEKSRNDLQGLIAQLLRMISSGMPIPEEWVIQIELDLDHAGRPMDLEIDWLKLMASRAEDPEGVLRQRLNLLKENYGTAKLETLLAWIEWIEQEPANWKEELGELIRAAKTALIERVESLPMERQINFADRILQLYERVCLFCLDKQDPLVMELLVPWTYQIKGFSMRIQYFALWKMRQKNRRGDYLKFADLSLKIVDHSAARLEEEGLLEKWKGERDALMKSLSIYQDFALEIGAEAFVPMLPKEKKVFEFVVTVREVFAFENVDGTWSYRHLGDKAGWERRILGFRRKLMRGRADFKGIATEIFGQLDESDEISWAPDGIFFTLPFSELFAEAGIQDYEIWPNHLYAKSGKRKFQAAAGTMIVADEVEGKPKLEYANREIWELIKLGLQPERADRRKEYYLRDYRGFFHFTGHGEVVADSDGSPKNPFVASRLVLPNKQAMTALDFSILNWRACPLVFLNACESGSGAYVPSQGVLGLSYGLFLGGAQTLIVTQYPVSDQIACRLSSIFYDALLQTGSRHYAFLIAKQMLSDQGVSDRDLAAFQLIGSGEQLLETRRSRIMRMVRIQKARWRLRGEEGSSELPSLGKLFGQWLNRKRVLLFARFR